MTTWQVLKRSGHPDSETGVWSELVDGTYETDSMFIYGYRVAGNDVGGYELQQLHKGQWRYCSTFSHLRNASIALGRCAGTRDEHESVNFWRGFYRATIN